MQWIISVGLGLLILPSFLIVIDPLLNTAFSSSFFEFLNPVLGYLNTLIGSSNLNILLICLSFVMFMIFFRWVLRIVTSFK